MLKNENKTALIFFLITISILFFSLTQCCTSGNTNNQVQDNVKLVDYEKESLPHGSIKVSCTILQQKEENDKTIFVAIVDTVHGYGPGTKPIGIGAELELEPNNKLMNNPAITSTELFKINSHHKLLLIASPQGIKNTDIKIWKIISREY